MQSLAGKLLIASKTLMDPNFVQTVILIVQHDDNGALGLVLNRPLRTEHQGGL
jgi:putative transcriptional regulator